MFVLLLACVVAANGCAATRGPHGEPDSLHRIALHQALQSFSSAFLRADTEALDTFLVADYLHTNGGTGTVLDKPKWLAYIRRRHTDLESGRLRLSRYETMNLVIRWYPAAAVVSSQVVSEGLQDGVPFSSRLQVTQVWIRVRGQWRRAAFHDSPVSDR
jgi:hypothetical protein